MIEHLFSLLLGREIDHRIEAWVAAGQRSGAILDADGKGCRLAFGWRYRLQSVLCCFGFGIAFLVFCWLYITTRGAEVWLTVAYFGFVFPSFVLSGFLALGACTTRVTLSPRGLILRRFGMDSTQVKWSEISEVYRSPVMPSIVFVTTDRRRVRISTQLDGLAALPEHLQLVSPGAIHRSIVDWVIDSQPSAADHPPRCRC